MQVGEILVAGRNENYSSHQILRRMGRVMAAMDEAARATPGADEDFLDAILLRTDYKVNIKP